MKNVIIFIAGLLAGGVCVFYWLAQKYASPPPEARSVQTPRPPPQSAVPSAKPQPPAPTAPPSAAQPADRSTLAAPHLALQPLKGRLLIPVAGITARELADTYAQSRAQGRPHEAIDIVAPRGTPVLATDDGKVVKLFTSKPGGLTIYQFDRDEKLAYYYAHLDRYAAGIIEGKTLKRGELIGYVGSTGNASPNAPHLHFAIFELGPEKRWWEGTAINPYPLLSVAQ